MAKKHYWDINASSFRLVEIPVGCYFIDQAGFVMPADQMRDVAKKLIRYADHYEEVINKHNAIKQSYFDRLNSSHEHEEVPKTPRCVYLIRYQDKYKIGVAKDVAQRIKQLNGNIVPMELIAVSKPIKTAYSVEKDLHIEFDYYRVQGEWFELPQSEADRLAERIRTIEDAAV